MKDYNYILFNITMMSLGVENILSGYGLGGLLMITFIFILQLFKMNKYIDIKVIVLSMILIVINIILVYRFCNSFINVYLTLSICFNSLNISLWFNYLINTSTTNMIEMNKSNNIIFLAIMLFIIITYLFKLDYTAPIFILYSLILLSITIQIKFISILRIYKYNSTKVIN